MNTEREAKGRFAPSPTGRMHMGNVYAALMSWLDAKRVGGKWVLRIEDLDPQRSKMEYAHLLEDDLHWLGLDWDEGGIDGIGPNGPYCQSQRGDIYQLYFQRLANMGLTYKCHCTRADIMASQAPHETDGRVVYSGRCRPAPEPPFVLADGAGSTRLYVPDRMINFEDETYGPQSVNLKEHCGDFVLRRADGAWAYQLAVVIDDALMGITRVVRGADLLLSTAQQLYIYELLDFPTPAFAHLPLLCNSSGQRLSKRDHSMNMAELRTAHTPTEVIGMAAHQAGLLTNPIPITPKDLLEIS